MIVRFYALLLRKLPPAIFFPPLRNPFLSLFFFFFLTFISHFTSAYDFVFRSFRKYTGQRQLLEAQLTGVSFKCDKCLSFPLEVNLKIQQNAYACSSLSSYYSVHPNRSLSEISIAEASTLTTQKETGWGSCEVLCSNSGYSLSVGAQLLHCGSSIIAFRQLCEAEK